MGVRIKAQRHNFVSDSISAPKQFPRSKPVGCATAPRMPSSTGADVILQKAGDDACYMEGIPEEQWPALAHAIETEICRSTDTADAEGMAEPSYAGRARGVNTACKMVSPIAALRLWETWTKSRMP